MKKTYLKLLTLLSLSLMLLVGCGKAQEKAQTDLPEAWEDLLAQAKGSTVTFYGWGGSQQINQWLETEVAQQIQKDYQITFKRVGMNIDDILNQLLTEKAAGKAVGTADIIWINGENFYNAKENQLLYGPFNSKLPNYAQLVDGQLQEHQYDFGHPIEGYEAPFGKAQFVMAYRSDLYTEMPGDCDSLLAWAKAHPGQMTYPAPPDFTGSAFVRNIIYEKLGHEAFMHMEADEATVRKAIEPAIAYLKELAPYLWKEGSYYPADSALMNNLYADGEISVTMSYNPNEAANKIATGEFMESTKSFIFDKGSIGNTHFLAIAKNAPNKAGAMVVINALMSPELQASKYDPKHWGDLPVLDNSKMTAQAKSLFEAIPLGESTLPQDQLMAHRLPEMPAPLVPIIEKIWQENFASGQ